MCGCAHIAWDDCSDTPFLYDTSRKVVVTYDDTWSLGDKALFAKQNGMGGCFTWSLDQVRFLFLRLSPFDSFTSLRTGRVLWFSLGLMCDGS